MRDFSQHPKDSIREKVRHILDELEDGRCEHVRRNVRGAVMEM